MTPTRPLLHAVAFVVLLLTAVACGADGEREASGEEPLRFEETLVIGSNDPEAPDAELFSIVGEAVVASDGRMVLVDGQSNEIRLFDADGTFIRRIGATGSGPGELQRVGSIHLDDQNRLLVSDPRQGRITAFSLEGEVLGTYSLPDIPRVLSMNQLPDGRYVVGGYREDGMLHVTDSEFQSIQASFLPPKAVQTIEHDLAPIVMQFLPGKVAVIDGGRVAYAPAMFTGEVHILAETDSTWAQVATWSGPQTVEQPISITPMDQAERVDLPMRIQGRGEFGAQFHQLATGLYPDGDGAFLVTLTEGEEAHNVMAARFTPDGAIHAHARIDTSNGLALEPLAYDGDALYLSDRREYPVLRRMAVR